MALARALGAVSLTFYGVGIILGAGIYSVLGVAAGRTGAAVWMSFALSSAIALLTALSYAELATMMPRAGAEFSYLRSAFPRAPAFALVTGLLVALSGAATAATVAIAFGGYLQSFAPVPVALAAGGLLAAALALNVAGVKESSWVNVAFTAIEAGGLVLFIAVGAGSEKFGAAFAEAPAFAVVPGAALVFFSFLGFENIANLAEEAKQPQRDLPRALAAVLPRRKTPWLATLAVAAVSGALLPFGAVDVVASLSSFASLLAFAAVNAALIALRRREPKRERPFRVPGALAGVPLLPALGAIATLAIATQLDRTALVAGGGATLAFAAYAAWRRRA